MPPALEWMDTSSSPSTSSFSLLVDYQAMVPKGKMEIYVRTTNPTVGSSQLASSRENLDSKGSTVFRGFGEK